MAILYSVVARGTTVLAKYASCTGNFAEVTENILAKIPPRNDMLTYTQGKYLFHYICEDNIVYMCVTDDDFQKSKAFLYLTEIKRRFLAAYGATAQIAAPYAMNTDFARALASAMLHYSSSNQEVDVLASVLGDLDELKDIMEKNIDNVAMRGERLELLVNKTENLIANENEQELGALIILEKCKDLCYHWLHPYRCDICYCIYILRRPGLAKVRWKLIEIPNSRTRCVVSPKCDTKFDRVEHAKEHFTQSLHKRRN